MIVIKLFRKLFPKDQDLIEHTVRAETEISEVEVNVKVQDLSKDFEKHFESPTGHDSDPTLD